MQRYFQKYIKRFQKRKKELQKGASNSMKDIFSAPILVENVRFMLFLAFLALLYITNSRYADHTMIEINKMQKELKELRWSYMNSKSQLMYKSKQTEVAKLVAPLGLKGHDTMSPQKITIKAAPVFSAKDDTE